MASTDGVADLGGLVVELLIGTISISIGGLGGGAIDSAIFLYD